jgi:AraC family transcriptional regulator of arabinose operon
VVRSSDAAERPITAHTPVERIVTGHFHRAADYRTWRPRGSGDWLLIHTVAGAGQLELPAANGRSTLRRSLVPGEAVLFGLHAPQSYVTDPTAGRWELRWAHFQPRPHWRPWLRWPELAPGVGVVSFPLGAARRAWEQALVRMHHLARRPVAAAADLAASALEEALLWAQAVHTADPWTRVDPRVRRAMDYLAATVDRPFQLAAVASHCRLSVSRLSHLFKQEVGVTPQQHAEELRLALAAQLLRHTSLRIHEVAAEAGYDDAFYFARRFRRRFGRAPRDYRGSSVSPPLRSRRARD